MSVKYIEINKRTIYTFDTDTGAIKRIKPDEKIIYDPKTSVNVYSNQLDLINDIRTRAGADPIKSDGSRLTVPVTPNANYRLVDSNSLPLDAKPKANAVVIEPKLLGQNLKYPQNMNTNQVHVQFNSYDFSDVAKTNDTYSLLAGNLKLKSKFYTEVIAVQENQIPYAKDTIKIYAPQNIDVSYGANWSDQAKLSYFGNQITDKTNNPFSYFALVSVVSELVGMLNSLVKDP